MKINFLRRLDMTTLTTYKPGRTNVFDEMDKMMESMLGGNISNCKATRYPAVDVLDKEESFELSIELPGYNKDDVEIKVDNNLLTISASEIKEPETKEKTDKEDKTRYIIRERRSKKFSRTFVLPKNVEKDNIEAVFENGLLELVIPKSPKKEPKKIEIKIK
ncbi:MAG: Hsp20/alpha crystallin family protein [Spirochaetales bacterium]|nr:Hsp20/alpha crystallin family protein [Spirochaetales bacterium]